MKTTRLLLIFSFVSSIACSTDPHPSALKKKHIVEGLFLGDESTCVQKRGEAICSGRSAGILWDPSEPSLTSKPTKIKGLGGNIAVMGIGVQHGCAIKLDGSLWCWGENIFGQIGVGEFGNTPHPPTKISRPGEVYSKLAVGSRHNCAVRNGLELMCWGANDFGQIGMGDAFFPGVNVPTAVQHLRGPVKQLSLSDWNTCVLHEDEEMSCWGYGLEMTLCSKLACPLPVHLPGFGKLSSVEAGFSLMCGIGKESGAAKCIGIGYEGTVSSDSQNLVFHSPTVVEGFEANVKMITQNGAHFCGVIGGPDDPHDRVLCRGDNRKAQLGDPSDLDRAFKPPIEVQGLGKKIRHLASGSFHTCAVSKEKVYCWGFGPNGPLARGSVIFQPGADYNLVSPIGGTPEAVAMGEHHACLASTGTFGLNVVCSGRNDVGQLGDNQPYDSPEFSRVHLLDHNGPPDFFESGVTHTCISYANEVYCWGNNLLGAVGDGFGVAKPVARTPTAVAGISTTANIVSMDVGGVSACIVDHQTLTRVYCWGANNSGVAGQLLSTHPISVNEAKEVIGGDFGNNPNMKVAVGFTHTCVWTPAFADCWGDNGSGQLGAGIAVPYTENRTPVKMGPSGPNLTGVLHMSSSAGFTCAVALVGSVIKGFCWGGNYYGELGMGQAGGAGGLGKSFHPVELPNLQGVGLEKIVTGRMMACALVDSLETAGSKGVVCWGRNREGQLGDGTTQNRYSADPRNIKHFVRGAESNVVDIFPGEWSTCVKKSDESIRCFGMNTSGQFEKASNAFRSPPLETLFGFFL